MWTIRKKILKINSRLNGEKKKIRTLWKEG